MNDSSRAIGDRLEQAAQLIPAETLDNLEGSFGFRQFAVKKLLHDLLKNLGAS